NPHDIEMYILQKLEISNAKPDVILIDHVDLLYSLEKNKTDLFSRFEDVMMDLKNIAEKYNIAIITASQLNREGAKQRKDISLSFGDVISRSMAKNELVSFHAILQATPEENVSNFMRIYVDKNRFGLQNIVFPIYFDKSRCEIKEILTEEEFEVYMQSISTLLNQNKRAQRIVNIMKQFIQSLNDRIQKDYVSYQQNILKAFHDMKNSLNDIDEFVENNTYDIHIPDDENFDNDYNEENDNLVKTIAENIDENEVKEGEIQNTEITNTEKDNLERIYTQNDSKNNDTSYIDEMLNPLKLAEKRFLGNKDFDELEIQREILGSALDENAYTKQDSDVSSNTESKGNVVYSGSNGMQKDNLGNENRNETDRKLRFEILTPGSFKSFIQKAKKSNTSLEELVENSEKYNEKIKGEVLKTTQKQVSNNNNDGKGGKEVMYKNRNLKMYMELLSEMVNRDKVDDAIKKGNYQDFDISTVKDLISFISLNILKFHDDGIVNKERMIHKKISKKSGKEYYKVDALYNSHYRYFVFLDDEVLSNIYENILPYYYEKYGIDKHNISFKEFLTIILLLGVFDNRSEDSELITLYDMEYIPKGMPIVIENMVDASDIFYEEKITKGTIENIRLVIEQLRENSKNGKISIDDDVVLLVFKNVVIAISYNTFERIMNYVYDKLIFNKYETENVRGFIQRITNNFKFINIVNAVEKVKPYVLTLDNFLIYRYLANLSMLSYLINLRFMSEKSERSE
ncbi:MAG: hypothetical protein QW607_11945, partial [Desulfurococcaceae archaeon]